MVCNNLLLKTVLIGDKVVFFAFKFRLLALPKEVKMSLRLFNSEIFGSRKIVASSANPSTLSSFDQCSTENCPSELELINFKNSGSIAIMNNKTLKGMP